MPIRLHEKHERITIKGYMKQLRYKREASREAQKVNTFRLITN